MKKIIFAGKGGAGKTTLLSLTIARLLQVQPDARILVVDADPAANLLTSLGLQKPQTKPIGELSDLMPENWNTFEPSFFTAFETDSNSPITLNNQTFHYAYLGHHMNHSCMCAYNNALNYLLKHIESFDAYEYIFIDREAGVEHINRSVYGEKDDRLVVVSTPSEEYLGVAAEIFELADMLGTTKKRILIINNNQGLEFSEQDLHTELERLNLSMEYILMPKINVFSGLQKLPASMVLEQSPGLQEKIDTILDILE